MNKINAPDSNVYDVFGVGFGPAGMALAIALSEDTKLTFRWADKSAGPGWQPGLLLEGSNINHHFFRDLATPRNPRSEYTFANFLKVHNRLYEFGYWSGAVSRMDWHLYVKWVGEKFSEYVDYNTEVVEITYDEDSRLYKIASQDGKEYLSRFLVVSVGMENSFPPAFTDIASDNIRHGCDYLFYKERLTDGIKKSQVKDVLVIGSGLGAIEILIDLLSDFRDLITIDSTHRSMPFRNYEQSPFSNIIYTPEESRYYKSLSKSQRESFLNSVLNTNFSAVDAEISALFWNKVYESKLFGYNNLNIIPRVTPVSAKKIEGGKIEVKLVNLFDDAVRIKQYDFVICATGVKDTIAPRLFAGISNRFLLDEKGEISLNSDYSVVHKNEQTSTCYANGHYEPLVGIADTQSFSLVAYKADIIINSILNTV